MNTANNTGETNMQQEMNSRLNQLFDQEVLYKIRRHDDAHAMYAWMLGTYKMFLNATESEQQDIDHQLSAAYEESGVKATVASTTLHKIVKLATGGDRKFVSCAVRIINVLVSNKVQEIDCAVWIKNNGGLNAVYRNFNKDGSTRINKVSRNDVLKSFVQERVNSNLSQEELILWLTGNSNELVGILSM